jgi:hypothetical protein
MKDVKAAANILTEQQILTDTLNSEKMLTGVYNTFACECVCDNLRATMLDILTDVHHIQAGFFKDMQERGWYKTEQATPAKIKQAKQKAATAS